MENPQKENGYTAIANELIEALARIKLTSQESRVLFAILRKTYGYNKKDDWISNSQLELITGIHRTHCAHTVTRLISRKIVAKTGNKIQFNKMYNTWSSVPKQATKQALVPKQAITSAQTGNQLVLKQAHTKDNYTKYNITKDSIWLEWWRLYPNRVGKAAAVKAWMKLTLDERELALGVLPKHIDSNSWQKNGGQFIPHPATWLNNRRWEDEIQEDQGGICIVPSSTDL